MYRVCRGAQPDVLAHGATVQILGIFRVPDHDTAEDQLLTGSRAMAGYTADNASVPAGAVSRGHNYDVCAGMLVRDVSNTVWSLKQHTRQVLIVRSKP